MKSIAVSLMLLAVATTVSADWDPELEAREQAEREAAQRVEQAQQREAQRQIDAAHAQANRQLMESKRKTVGAAANGKSDAEVNRLYDAKVQQTTEEANRAAATARDAMSHGQGAAALKQVTGKSLQELENMSDEEAEALSREMERKYGQ